MKRLLPLVLIFAVPVGRARASWTYSGTYSWHVTATCCSGGTCSTGGVSGGDNLLQGGLSAADCAYLKTSLGGALTTIRAVYQSQLALCQASACTCSGDFQIGNSRCSGFDDFGAGSFNGQGAFSQTGEGVAQFSPHYTSDFEEWSTDAMARWRAFRARNALVQSEGVNIWPNGRFGGLVEGIYNKIAARQKARPAPLYPSLDGSSAPESSDEYAGHYVDYKMLKADEPSYAQLAGESLLNGELEKQPGCGCQPSASVAPGYSIQYNSLRGGQYEAAEQKVERFPDGRSVFTDDGNTRWIFRPYGSADREKGDNYYKPPPGCAYRLVYGDITGHARGYRVESPDGGVMEFSTAPGRDLWRPSRYNAADGSWLTYDYGTNGLARITDMHGRYFACERDARGLPLTVTDNDGKKTTYSYDAAGRVTAALLPDGFKKQFTYDPAGLMTSARNGALAAEHYTYDPSGRLLTSESEGGVNRLEHYYYDASSKTAIADAFGAKTVFTYKNEGGHKLTTAVTDALGGKTALTYDANYNIASATDQLGRAARYARNNNGDPEAITDALGNTATIQYQVKLNYKDVLGEHTDYYSRPVKITDALGRKTKLDYDSYGNLARTEDALGNKTGMAYDKAGHMLELRDAMGATYKYEYTMGLTRSVDPLGRVTKYKRDADLHVTQLVDPLGRSTTFTYDLSGNVTEVRNPANFVTKFAYGNGACPSCGGSQLSALTDPKGNTWTFGYDQYGRLTDTANPLGQRKAYAYDKMSRVTEVKDPAGNVTAYTYDALNRLTRKDIQTPSGVHAVTTYTYDAVGNMLSASNGESSVAFVYDALNRAVETRQSFAGKTYTISYAYDAVGNRTMMATPWGKYSYTYDVLNRVNAITNPQGIQINFKYDAAGRRTGKTVFAAARNTAPLAETAYSYDAAGQLLSITNKAGGKVVAFDNYTYDALGNRVRIEDQDGVKDYTYDKSSRLIVVKPVPFNMANAEAFVYDRNGNRRYDRGAKDYKYDAANRLLENTVYTYTHDQLGNLTSRTEIASSATIIYAYNPEQQLFEVVTPKDKLEYKYDPLGRRTGRTVNGATVHYVYDGQDIITELDEAGTPINTYTNGPGIDEPLVMSKPEGKAYYYHADALGSITAITDDARKLVETYTYKSYGQATVKDAGGQISADSQVGNLRMFAAREFEPELGLYNNRHRYLDPMRGAFTQEDPIGFEGKDLNLFEYVFSSPQRSGDSLGLITDEQLGNKENHLPQNDSPLLTKQDIVNWLRSYGKVQINFNAGTGVVGGSGQLQITETGLYGRVGGGWGIGWGMSGGPSVSIGKNSGWGFWVSGSGGNGRVGSSISGGYSQGGLNGSYSYGWGVGNGESAVFGYKGLILAFPQSSNVCTK